MRAKEINPHPRAGVQVLHAPPILLTNNPNKEIHEMSYFNTQALIESLIILFKVKARNRSLRLQPAIRAP
jgi:hypothetical protein